MSWNKLNKLYENMHEEILRDIARRILSAEETLGKPGLTESARWQIYMLQESGVLYNDLVNKVAKYSNLNKSTIVDIFKTEQVEVYKDKKLNTKRLDKHKTLRINRLIDRGINRTINEVNNLTMTTALDTSNVFKDELNKAYMKVINGTESYDSAITKAISNLANNSAKITYPTGLRTSLETATRRAVLTSVNQVAGKLAIENARELGTNLMEISAHAGARPSHAVWQGKIVSLDPNYSGDEYLTLNDIGYGTPGGFKGCNCRHNWHPYFEDSPRAYSEEDLNKINNQTIEYEGKEISLYDAKVYQRRLEYDVRRAKNEYIICDEMLNKEVPTEKRVERYIQAKAKLDEKQRKLSEYTKKTKLQRNSTSTGKSTTPGQITKIKRDYEQFNKYKEVLKDSLNIPTTIEKFIELKYNKLDEYNLLKYDYYLRHKVIKDNLDTFCSINIDNKKFTDYLFNPKNEKGYIKGKLITDVLGYDINNYEELEKLIKHNISKYPYSFKGENQFGKRYEANMVVMGKKDRRAKITVGLFMENNNEVKMTSMYINKLKVGDFK